MRYDPDRHHRRSIRLRGYDYTAPGAYFVTVCTYQKACLLGHVVDGEMRLNDAGRVVHQTWSRLPERFPSICPDAFVAMPNHVHGIILLAPEPQPPSTVVAQPPPTVGAQPSSTVVAQSPPTAVAQPPPLAVAQPPSTVVAQPPPTVVLQSPPTIVPQPPLTAVVPHIVGAQFIAPITPGVAPREGAGVMNHAPTVGEIIRAFKAASTRGVRQSADEGFGWQHNYYERVVRGEEELRRIREYIVTNPTQWALDPENPSPTQ